MGILVPCSNILPFQGALWFQSWSAGEFLFEVFLPYFFLLCSFSRPTFFFAVWSKNDWTVYRFTFCSFRQTAPFPPLNIYVLLVPPFLIFCAILWFIFYFLPSPVVPVFRVSTSLHLHALGVPHNSFIILFFFLVPLYGLLLDPYESISLFMVPWMRQGWLRTFLWDIYWVCSWTYILFLSISVHTQIVFVLLIFYCMCNYHIHLETLSPCQFPLSFYSSISSCILPKNIVWILP